ncbi:MAG: hypothetical protein WCI51_12455 [Lentisphaerota bacterium]
MAKMIFLKTLLLRRLVSTRLFVGSMANQENKEFIFMGYQPLADVVDLMVRQWRMLVQHPEFFWDCLSAETVFLGGQNEVLSMKKNSIYNKLSFYVNSI